MTSTRVIWKDKADCPMAEKPPLGVMPERVWKDQRIIELCAAINR